MYLLNRRTVSKAKPILLLHCNGADESTTFTDNSPTGASFTRASVEIDTAQSKFGGASALSAGGAANYIKGPTGTDYNITTNFTIDMFIRHSDVTGFQRYIFYGDATDNWRFAKTVAHALIFTVEDTNVAVVQLSAGELAVDTWYHIAMCKVGNEYGLYLDGVQIAHVSDASTVSLDDYIYLCSDNTLDTGIIGWIDEVRICASNPFNAAPVVGLTDKIQVPQQPYPSWS